MRILIASHGEFAKGIKSSLEIIMGPKENVEFINAYTTEESLEDSIKNVMDKIDLEKEKLIVFTDLMGGSVNQYFVNNYDISKFHLISGVNLPVLLELSLANEENITKEFINGVIESARQQLLYVEKMEINQGDDFDF